MKPIDFGADLIGCVGSSGSVQLRFKFNSVNYGLCLEFIKSPLGLGFCINRGAWHSLKMEILGMNTMPKLL